MSDTGARKAKHGTDSLKYLMSSNYLDEYQDYFGNKISKTKIAALAISLLKRLYPQSPYNNVEEDQENVEGELVTTKSGQPDQAPKVMTLSEEFVSFLESENHECEAGVGFKFFKNRF